MHEAGTEHSKVADEIIIAAAEAAAAEAAATETAAVETAAAEKAVARDRRLLGRRAEQGAATGPLPRGGP